MELRKKLLNLLTETRAADRIRQCKKPSRQAENRGVQSWFRQNQAKKHHQTVVCELARTAQNRWTQSPALWKESQHRLSQSSNSPASNYSSSDGTPTHFSSASFHSLTPSPTSPADTNRSFLPTQFGTKLIISSSPSASWIRFKENPRSSREGNKLSLRSEEWPQLQQRIGYTTARANQNGAEVDQENQSPTKTSCWTSMIKPAKWLAGDGEKMRVSELTKRRAVLFSITEDDRMITETHVTGSSNVKNSWMVYSGFGATSNHMQRWEISASLTFTITWYHNFLSFEFFFI